MTWYQPTANLKKRQTQNSQLKTCLFISTVWLVRQSTVNLAPCWRIKINQTTTLSSIVPSFFNHLLIFFIKSKPLTWTKISWDINIRQPSLSLYSCLDGVTYLQCDVTELSYFIEMPEGVMEVLPSLMSLKDKGPVRLTVCFRGPVSRSLLLGLQLLRMVWHHIPGCHSWLQKTTPIRKREIIF